MKYYGVNAWGQTLGRSQGTVQVVESEVSEGSLQGGCRQRVRSCRILEYEEGRWMG